MGRDKALIIANWKMNLTVNEASLYLHALSERIQSHRTVEVVLAPTLLALQSLSLQIDHRRFKMAVQNFYWRDHGAFTGEVSAAQLHGIVQYALVGHSERRQVFQEPERDIRAKVQAALRNNITPVLCIGETATERVEGEMEAVLHDQLTSGLANITSEDLVRLVIAYEPVWAIGTGNNATPEDVKRAIQSIRRHISHMFGPKEGNAVRVLYGGSVNSASAGAYIGLDDVDGLLIGGASLRLEEFTDIINQTHTLVKARQRG